MKKHKCVIQNDTILLKFMDCNGKIINLSIIISIEMSIYYLFIILAEYEGRVRPTVLWQFIPMHKLQQCTLYACRCERKICAHRIKISMPK